MLRRTARNPYGLRLCATPSTTRFVSRIVFGTSSA
ncbi:MAG: hypothetical protein ACI8UD_003637, partial [Planctomycetota bacterium]